mgnify:CR=1 FL=1
MEYLLKNQEMVYVPVEETTEYKTLTIEEHVNLYIEDGKSSMDAIKIVAKERGMKKSEVYDIYHNIEKKW